MAKIPPLTKVYVADGESPTSKDIQDLQNNTQIVLNKIGNNPFFGAKIIKGVTLTANVNTTINTGQQIQGWFVVGNTSAAFQIPKEIARSSSQLTLQSNVNVTFDIMVF